MGERRTARGIRLEVASPLQSDIRDPVGSKVYGVFYALTVPFRAERERARDTKKVTPRLGSERLGTHVSVYSDLVRNTLAKKLFPPRVKTD